MRFPWQKRPPTSEPIILAFQCDDIIINSRPPADLVDEVRKIAMDQAAHTRCFRCAPWVWEDVGPLWQPELQHALEDAWNK